MNGANCLRYRSAHELRVIGNLSNVWPFISPDPIFSAAHAVDTMKKKHGDLWNAMCDTCEPKVIADMVVDVTLSRL